MLPRFQPRPLPEGSIKTIYRDDGRTAYHLRGEISGHGEVRRLRGSMKHDTDIFTVFAGPMDSDVHRLEYHVTSGDCFVSPRLRYMERAITKWLEDEHPNPTQDYLWAGF